MRWLRLTLPMTAPFIVYFVYQPINERWKVKRFGCGCRALDGSTFNANHFNGMLWLAVFLVCC